MSAPAADAPARAGAERHERVAWIVTQEPLRLERVWVVPVARCATRDTSMSVTWLGVPTIWAHTVMMQCGRGDRDVRPARDGQARLLTRGARRGQYSVFCAVFWNTDDGREVPQRFVEHAAACTRGSVSAKTG